jgi:hypothetical protein
MSSNVSDILKQLEALSTTAGISVYIPSLKKAVRFKNINLKQQKDLLKSTIDDTLTKLSFTTKFYSIIQENATDVLDVNKLYTFDRSAIALALRANGLSATFNNINLNDIIAQTQTINVDLETLKASIGIQDLTIELEAPTLGVDRDINLTTTARLKNVSDKDVKTLIGELFVHEIVKFIKLITFKTESGEQSVNFSELKVDDKISVTEQLPSTATNKILDFIRTYRAFENKFTSLNNVSIDVDSSFFSV